MTDYSTLDAGNDLDRFIAARLGYHVKRLRSGYYALIDPSGKEVRATPAGEKQAWEFVPPYSTDANAALKLVAGLDFCLTWAEYYDGPGDWNAEIGTDERYPSYVCSDDSAALAIVMAWLQWKDAQS